MKKQENPLYKKSLLRLIKITSVCLFCFVLIYQISNVFLFVTSYDFSISHNIFMAILISTANFFSLIIFIIVFFNPSKIGFLAASIFMYSILTFLTKELYPIEVLYYYLGMIILLARGFYHKKRILKYKRENLEIEFVDLNQYFRKDYAYYHYQGTGTTSDTCDNKVQWFVIQNVQDIMNY